jgi:hypothetical protein
MSDPETLKCPRVAWIEERFGSRGWRVFVRCGSWVGGNVQKKCPTRRPSRRLRQIVHGVVTTINTTTSYRTYFHYQYVIKFTTTSRVQTLIKCAYDVRTLAFMGLSYHLRPWDNRLTKSPLNNPRNILWRNPKTLQTRPSGNRSSGGRRIRHFIPQLGSPWNRRSSVMPTSQHWRRMVNHAVTPYWS